MNFQAFEQKHFSCSVLWNKPHQGPSSPPIPPAFFFYRQQAQLPTGHNNPGEAGPQCAFVFVSVWVFMHVCLCVCVAWLDRGMLWLTPGWAVTMDQLYHTAGKFLPDMGGEKREREKKEKQKLKLKRLQSTETLQSSFQNCDTGSSLFGFSSRNYGEIQLLNTDCFSSM